MRSLSILLVCACWAACAEYNIDERYDQGLQLLYENRHEDAEIHFLSLARELVRSDLPEAIKWRAKALYQAGKIDFLYLDQPKRAIGRLREALKTNPEADFAFDARYEIASIYYSRLMDYRNAALAYERLAHEFPKRENIAQYQYRLAQCYFLLRDFNQARAEARLLHKKWPKSPFVQEARLLIANSYYLENRLSESVKAHQELLESQPDVPIRARSLFELGICYRDLGERENAEKYLLSALKDHPRPDLVQMQLHALKDQIDKESQSAQKVSTTPRNASSPKKRSGSVGSSNQIHPGQRKKQRTDPVDKQVRTLKKPPKKSKEKEATAVVPIQKTPVAADQPKAVENPKTDEKPETALPGSGKPTKIKQPSTQSTKQPRLKSDPTPAQPMQSAPKDVVTPDQQ